MKKDLNYFLFKMEVLQKGRVKKSSFFRFQNDLAKAIVDTPGPYDTKEVKNMRPYLNQVLKPGGTSYEKPMSENLKVQILKILKGKLSEKDPIYPKLEEAFSTAYDLLKQAKKELPKSSTDKDYEEFVLWGLKANTFVTLLSEPGEIFWSAKQNTKNDIDFLLNRLFEIIFKNFNRKEDEIISILKSEKLPLSYVTDSINSFTYKFYVPNYSVGINLWKSLFHFFYEEKLFDGNISKQDRIKIASVFFKLINHYEPKNTSNSLSFINVYKIDPHLTVIPLVFCQSLEGISTAGKAKAHEEIFVMSLRKGIIKNVEKLSLANKKIWKEHVYFHLNNDSGQNKFGIEEIVFSDHMHDILSKIDF